MERGPVGVPMKDRARTRVIRRDNDPIMRSKMAVDTDVVMIADEYVIFLVQTGKRIYYITVTEHSRFRETFVITGLIITKVKHITAVI